MNRPKARLTWCIVLATSPRAAGHGPGRYSSSRASTESSSPRTIPTKCSAHWLWSIQVPGRDKFSSQQPNLHLQWPKDDWSLNVSFLTKLADLLQNWSNRRLTSTWTATCLWRGTGASLQSRVIGAEALTVCSWSRCFTTSSSRSILAWRHCSLKKVRCSVSLHLKRRPGSKMKSWSSMRITRPNVSENIDLKRWLRCSCWQLCRRGIAIHSFWN